IVRILNVVDGCIPSDRATGTPEEIEEERRLLYVAMTRAKDELDLIVPQRFFTHQKAKLGDRHVYASRSRFIPDSILRSFATRSWRDQTDGPIEAARKAGFSVDGSRPMTAHVYRRDRGDVNPLGPRDETLAGRDDPTIAPTHDRVDPSYAWYRISPRRPPYAIRSFPDGRPASNFKEVPALDRCRSRFWHWCGFGGNLRALNRRRLRNANSLSRQQ